MARLLATSRYATDLLEREPEGVKLLSSDQLVPGDREALEAEMLAAGGRQDDRDGRDPPGPRGAAPRAAAHRRRATCPG